MNVINKKYKIIQKIGEGSFGCIYKCQNIRTDEYLAIKVEPIVNDTKLLKNESTIYQYLQNTEGIPTIKWFGKDLKNYYMVIDLLGESLETIKKKYTVFSLKVVLHIGIKVINLLRLIHEKGLIHRDIKPENFLLGFGNKKKNIYMIDFGFCKSYIRDGNHILERKTSNLIGSPTYASINAHNFIELTRRDDLESLGYMLIYFYLGTLSWQDISELSINETTNVNCTNDINNKIKYLKERILETNIPLVFIEYMKYVKQLEFSEKPNYELIISILSKNNYI